MEEANLKCSSCGSTYNKMFLMGKQGNADTCPLCGGNLQGENEHPDWITWYYYKDEETNCCTLRDEPIDLEKWKDSRLIKEFKAPPRDSSGSSEKAKEILRTYVPDAFVVKQSPENEVRCPRCFSKEIQLVPKRFSILTGFATNRYDRMCIRCRKKF